MSSIIPVNRECNMNCIYCSASRNEADLPVKVKKKIEAERDQIVFTGGEPLLCRELPEYIRLAGKQGIKEIELQSNGSLFYRMKTAKSFAGLGISIFNISIPSHLESIHDRITNTSGLLEKRLLGVKNLLDCGANVRITHVICSLNQQSLFDFARFVHQRFSGIGLLEFNTVKLRGNCLQQKWLVPDLNKMDGELLKAVKYCERNKLRVLVDGVPLCHLKGIESHSIELIKLCNNKTQRLHAQKEKAKQCEGCSLNGLCRGFRKGYLEILGPSQVKPSNLNPEKLKGVLV